MSNKKTTESKIIRAESSLPSLYEDLYMQSDRERFMDLEHWLPMHSQNLKTLDELLDRDEQREEDGFHRKIRVGRIIRPGSGNNKVVIVPTTTEEKFYHDTRKQKEDEEKDSSGESNEIGQTTGTADGNEGDIIGEVPVETEEGQQGKEGGEGEGANHEVGSSAYELGEVLTKKFQLPNLEDKGKKKSLTRFVYELTDQNRGEGQVLDKRRTLVEVLKTNINLGKLDPDKDLEPSNLVINPRDFIYRTMSRERDVEAQAVVFFARDYSGSMHGKPTEVVGAQHVMIYSWLVFQYHENVQTRFILHDTDAKEVKNFHTYHNSHVAGGTQIRSAFKKINEIIKKEDLFRDYNIYVFYGGDGDDWNNNEDEFKEEFEELSNSVNRLGITIVKTRSGNQTIFEKFIHTHKFLEKFKGKVQLDLLGENADDKKIIHSIKNLVR